MEQESRARFLCVLFYLLFLSQCIGNFIVFFLRFHKCITCWYSSNVIWSIEKYKIFLLLFMCLYCGFISSICRWTCRIIAAPYCSIFSEQMFFNEIIQRVSEKNSLISMAWEIYEVAPLKWKNYVYSSIEFAYIFRSEWIAQITRGSFSRKID